jgi:phage baseplate assembly protein gpV
MEFLFRATNRPVQAVDGKTNITEATSNHTISDWLLVVERVNGQHLRLQGMDGMRVTPKFESKGGHSEGEGTGSKRIRSDATNPPRMAGGYSLAGCAGRIRGSEEDATWKKDLVSVAL